MIEEGRYKNATANVVKVLAQRGQLAADLEDRLNALIDRRNELTHRWFLRNGWPASDENEPGSYADVIRLAQCVRAEADAITHMMAGYMLKYAHPDQHEQDPEAVKTAVTEMFHRVHVQDQTNMVVKKIDAARRQLITAIRLFFDGGDPVSVYSLASNAWEVIDVLCVSAGVESFSKQARESLPAGHTLKYYINEPCRNFFKHAAQDPNPDSSVELREANVAAMLFLAAEDYIRFRQGGPVDVQVFQLWFIATFPEKIAEDDSVAQSKLESAQLAFPDIATLPWSDKVEMGRQVLEAARNDAGLQADPKTEPSV